MIATRSGTLATEHAERNVMNKLDDFIDFFIDAEMPNFHFIGEIKFFIWV